MIPANSQLARTLARAQEGRIKDQVRLGVVLEFGQGLPINEVGAGVCMSQEQAVRWYRLAADQGHGGACGNLARACGYGKGVLRDPKAAYFWALLAKDSQLEISGTPLDKFAQGLLREMSAEEARLIEIQVQDWRRDHPLSKRGLYFVELSTGSSYIETSTTAVSPR